MKTLIVVDSDVEFSSLYKTSQTKWHSQGAGFVSIEYFYLVDDEFAAKLITSRYSSQLAKKRTLSER